MSKSKEPKPVSKFTKGQKGYFRILKEYAGKFQQWLDLIERKDTRIGRKDTLDSLANLVFEVNFQKVLGWLERTRPSMFGPLKRALNNIRTYVKIIYQTKEVRFSFKPPMGKKSANQGSELQNWPKFYYPNPLWFPELQDKNEPHFISGDTDFQELKERVLLLANLLEGTADDLQETKQPPEASGEAGDSPVTLREFMREYCKGLTENLLESRVKSLQSLYQRGKIKLQHVEKWERGQSKKYLPSFLISKWPTYRKILQSLPELK